MQVIHKNFKGCHRAAVSGSTSSIAIVLSGLLVVAAAFYAGKEYGVARSHGWSGADTRSLLAGWGAKKNGVVRRETEGQLRALMLRLGELQSQMLRLNAVGRRVVAKLNVDSSEFDFSEPPGIGGPLSERDEPKSLPVNMNRVMAILSHDMAHRGVQLKMLDSMLTNAALKKEAFPVGNPVNSGRLSSRFGWRTDPFTGRRKFHHGVDLAARRGAKVVAAASGLVTWAGKRGGYGNLVEITHADGYVTRYGHSSKILVSRGQMVRRGHPIARVGSTGRSTGPHLHYEVLLNGKKVDPTKYIKASI
jgi:Peptidase family M23